VKTVVYMNIIKNSSFHFFIIEMNDWYKLSITISLFKSSMKISELCKMIEDSIHSGKYPLQDKQQKHWTNLVEVINRSDSEDLKSSDIKIEIRIQNLYTINNYVPNIQHLPGVIEIDVLDSVKMLCRRLEKVVVDMSGNSYPKDMTMATERLHKNKDQNS